MGIMGMRGIRGISSSHSHSHSLTITNNGFHKGGPPRSGGPPLWRRPKAASIVGDGEAVAVAVAVAVAAAYTPYTPYTHYTSDIYGIYLYIVGLRLYIIPLNIFSGLAFGGLRFLIPNRCVTQLRAEWW